MHYMRNLHFGTYGMSLLDGGPCYNNNNTNVSTSVDNRKYSDKEYNKI